MRRPPSTRAPVIAHLPAVDSRAGTRCDGDAARSDETSRPAREHRRPPASRLPQSGSAKRWPRSSRSRAGLDGDASALIVAHAATSSAPGSDLDRARSDRVRTSPSIITVDRPELERRHGAGAADVAPRAASRCVPAKIFGNARQEACAGPSARSGSRSSVAVGADRRAARCTSAAGEAAVGERQQSQRSSSRVPPSISSGKARARRATAATSTAAK